MKKQDIDNSFYQHGKLYADFRDKITLKQYNSIVNSLDILQQQTYVCYQESSEYLCKMNDFIDENESLKKSLEFKNSEIQNLKKCLESKETENLYLKKLIDKKDIKLDNSNILNNNIHTTYSNIIYNEQSDTMSDTKQDISTLYPNLFLNNDIKDFKYRDTGDSIFDDTEDIILVIIEDPETSGMQYRQQIIKPNGTISEVKLKELQAFDPAEDKDEDFDPVRKKKYNYIPNRFERHHINPKGLKKLKIERSELLNYGIKIPDNINKNINKNNSSNPNTSNIVHSGNKENNTNKILQSAKKEKNTKYSHLSAEIRQNIKKTQNNLNKHTKTLDNYKQGSSIYNNKKLKIQELEEKLKLLQTGK